MQGKWGETKWKGERRKEKGEGRREKKGKREKGCIVCA